MPVTELSATVESTNADKRTLILEKAEGHSMKR